MKEVIDTVQYASLLYDFYGALLGESQNEVMTMYHEDNLSLAEIAEEMGTSRQAVHYTLKKAEAKLEEFEDKLGLLEEYKKNQERAAAAIEIIESMINEENRNRLLEVIEIIRSIVE